MNSSQLGLFAEETMTDLWDGLQRPKTLVDTFVVPPFSVLDARQGYWQKRKRAWLEMGIESEIGRKDVEAMRSIQDQSWVERKIESGDLAGGLASGQTGTSVFDPVLCEIIYRWFSPLGARILDPFAGGSVRGLVAGYLGREYVGVELRPEQVEANRAQAGIVDMPPQWIVGDSANIVGLAPGYYDLLFTCPPYYDLEVYSNRPGELSALPSYAAFLESYRYIIKESVGLLRQNRYACIVVSDIRDKRGHYRNLVGDTITAFLDAGCKLYNEAILVTSIGSLPIRVGRQFKAGRKLGKAHQNVLVFVKGNGRKAADACGPIEMD